MTYTGPEHLHILIITHSDNYPDNAVTRDLASMGHHLYWRRTIHGENLMEAERGKSFDAAVSFGGPQFVTEIDDLPWMQTEVAWVKNFVESGGHFLGVCLGAQILAHAFGGKVWRYPDESSEVGVYQVSPTPEAKALGFMCKTSAFYQWHLEGFECPKGSMRLATSNLFPNQAFKLGERSYGLQFHPEIDATAIKRWTSTVLENKSFIFDRPQVRPAESHLSEWQQEEAKISTWRQGFLHNWLAA